MDRQVPPFLSVVSCVPLEEGLEGGFCFQGTHCLSLTPASLSRARLQGPRCSIGVLVLRATPPSSLPSPRLALLV